MSGNKKSGHKHKDEDHRLIAWIHIVVDEDSRGGESELEGSRYVITVEGTSK